MNDVFGILPDRIRFLLYGMNTAGLTDLYLTVDTPLCARIAGRTVTVGDPTPVVTAADVDEVLMKACRYAVYAHEEELRRGFISLPGGHRLGVAGTAVYEKNGLVSVREPVSLCLRIASQRRGCAEVIAPMVFRGSVPKTTLLISPPGCGKTTLLRDLCRIASEKGNHVCIVDTRGEIGGVSDRKSPFCLGSLCSILTGYEKRDGIEIAVRTMRPDIVAFDEVSSEEDSIADGAACGVAFFFTAHSATLGDAKKRHCLQSLWDRSLIDLVFRLDETYTATCTYNKESES